MEGYLVGLDIGTTKISATVLSIKEKKVADSYTTPNDSWIKSKENDIFEQDANKIYISVKSILDDICLKYGNIQSIGITGQMHGVLYIDDEGEAVSPFMIWQDRRAGRKINNDETYCDRILSLCGENVSVGYGLATHYYNVCNHLVHKNAIILCNITDYIAMKLTNSAEPIMHSSIAASLGFYDAENNCFKNDVIKELGMDCVKLPMVISEYAVLGKYCNIPVSIGIGDNQASFLGTVDDLENSILVNIGTGSQISMITDMCKTDNPELEIRPFLKNKNLLCGCAISGGASYAMLESFFRMYNNEPQYDKINNIAINAYNAGVEPLKVNTFFKGKRSNPNATGSIVGITDINFTPETLVLGFIYGMCQELYDFFGDTVKAKTKLIASGNAVQKNPVFRMVLSDMFNMPIYLSKSKEEASIGAALFAGVSAGILKNETEFSHFIRLGE